LSSVVALILGPVFLLIEKMICERPLARTFETLATRFDEILPHVSATPILIDIQPATLAAFGQFDLKSSLIHWHSLASAS